MSELAWRKDIVRPAHNSRPQKFVELSNECGTNHHYAEPLLAKRPVMRILRVGSPCRDLLCRLDFGGGGDRRLSDFRLERLEGVVGECSLVDKFILSTIMLCMKDRPLILNHQRSGGYLECPPTDPLSMPCSFLRCVKDPTSN